MKWNIFRFGLISSFKALKWYFEIQFSDTDLMSFQYEKSKHSSKKMFK